MNTYKIIFIAPDGSKYFIYINEGQSPIDAARDSGLNLPESALQSWCFSNPVLIASNENLNSLNYIDSLLNLPDETNSYSKRSDIK